MEVVKNKLNTIQFGDKYLDLEEITNEQKEKTRDSESKTR